MRKLSRTLVLLRRFKIDFGMDSRRFWKLLISITYSLGIFSTVGCLESDKLAGSKNSVGFNQLAGFKGCLTGTALNQNAINVSYEWPSDALSVSVLRNGIPVYTSLTGAGTYTDYGLLEGVSYTYTCTATFADSTVKTGTNSITVATLSINTPTFYGIQSAISQSSSSALVTWIPATGVPTAKYVVVAKLGSDPTLSDFDDTVAATQTLISKKQIIRSVLMGPGISQATLTGLGDQLPYHFAVQACSSVPHCTIGSNPNPYITVVMPDAGAPQTVGATSLQMVAGQAVIVAPWDASLGQISTRKVYQSTTGGTNLAAYTNVQNFTITDPTLTPTSLTLTGVLAERTTYYFVVRDVDQSGQQRAAINASEIVTVTTGDLTPPQNFLGIRTDGTLVSPVEGVATIKWYPPAPDGTPDPWWDYKGFRIYTVDASNNLTFLQDCNCSAYGCPEHLLQCNVSGFTPFRTYRFHVRAFDAAGNETITLSVATKSANLRIIDQTPPVFSSNVTAGYNAGITLSWSAYTYDNQYPLEPGATVNYQVWRKTSVPFINATNPNADADGGVPLVTQGSTTYLDTTVTDGRTYYYTICALDASLNRNCDGFVAVKSILDITPPTLLNLTDDKTVTGKTWNLSWNMADNITLHSLLSVSIYRKVSTSNVDWPTSADTSISTVANANYIEADVNGKTWLNSEGNPVIPGTAGLLRYVNYTILIADQAGNLTTGHRSVLLDNSPPSSNPVLISTTPTSPSNTVSSPTAFINLSANSASVVLYSDASCTAAITGGSGTAAQASAGLTLTLPANTTTQLYAIATTSAATTGPCVLIGSYTHDNIAPTIASVTATPQTLTSTTWNMTYGAIAVDATFYCILMNTTVNTGCIWQSMSSILPPQATYIATPIEGSNYLSVWVKDAAGNISTRAQSNSIIWDATPPTWANSINITTKTAPNWLQVNNGFTVTYTADATDANGILKYEYALGTGATGAAANNVIAWTSLGVPTGAQTLNLASLSLVENTTYYFSMRVFDTYSNVTSYTYSFNVDLTNPAAPTIASPTAGATVVLTTPAGNNTIYSGTCDSSAGNVTTVTPGTGVTINSSSCLSGVLSIDATYAFSSATRSLTITTAKPSGRSASLTHSVNVVATPSVAANAITSYTSSVTTASLVVNMPAGVVSGDLLVVFTIAGGLTLTPPAGWTEMGTTTNTFHAFYKISNGTEGATQTFTQGVASKGGKQAVTLRIIGANAVTPIDASSRNETLPNETLANGITNFSGTTMTITSAPASTIGGFQIGDVVSTGCAGCLTAHVVSMAAGTTGGAGTYTLDVSEPATTGAAADSSRPTSIAPSVTPTVSTGLLLAAYINVGGYSLNANVMTYPAGFTKVAENTYVSVGSKGITTGGATGSVTATRSEACFSQASITVFVK